MVGESDFAAAIPTKLHARGVLELAGRTQAGWFCSLAGSAAFAAKTHAGGQLGAAGCAAVHFEAGAAVVAEFALAGRLAAFGTDQGFALDFTLENLGLVSLGFDILNHFPGTCCGDSYILPRRTGNAKLHLFVVISLTNPLAAGAAAVEMGHRFILRHLEGFFMLFLPFRAHAVKPFAKNVGAPLDVVA